MFNQFQIKEDDLLSVSQASQILGVGYYTVKRWGDLGYIEIIDINKGMQGSAKHKRKLRIPYSEITRLIEAGRKRRK